VANQPTEGVTTDQMISVWTAEGLLQFTLHFYSWKWPWNSANILSNMYQGLYFQGQYRKHVKGLSQWSMTITCPTYIIAYVNTQGQLSALQIHTVNTDGKKKTYSW